MTQAGRILSLLKSYSEVSALQLAQISLQYCARIAELCRAGHKITNRTETIGGVRHGHYRLERRATLVPTNVEAARQPNALLSSVQLSGCSREMEYPD